MAALAERPDVAAPSEEALDDMKTEKSGSARNQDGGHEPQSDGSNPEGTWPTGAFGYTLGLERPFVRLSLGVEVGYVGSRGRNLPIFMEVNPGLYAPGQTSPGGRLFPAYSLVRPTFSAAESKYDSMQASLRMRPTRGVNFLVSYTLGEAKDHVSGLNIGGEPRPVRVLLDGKPVPARFAGRDVRDGIATVSAQRLYRLVELPRAERHRLTLEFAPGVSGYAFTFG